MHDTYLTYTHRMPQQLPGVKMTTCNGDLMSFNDLEEIRAMESDCIVCLLDSATASNTGVYVCMYLRIYMNMSAYNRPY